MAKSRKDAPYGAMLSLTEAAALLKCHHNTVRAWVRQGRLEAVPMGPEQVPMFRKADVEALRKPLEQAGVIVRDDKHAFPVVGIGASAGGLDAIARVLGHLPTDLGLAYVIVQHLETEREMVLADLLRKKTTMPVFVIENGMRLDPDRVYVAPANTHTAVINGTFTLRAPHDATRPIDAFFTALAAEYQNNAIGIVLSGTGTDGTDGLRAIRAEDGLTMTQDASALEQGMPRSAQDAEVVDLVVKPELVGKELTELVKQLYAGGQARIPSKYENELRRILNFLHTERGIDFSQYKEATIHRRIIRRMVLSKCRKLSDYSALLHGMPSEVDTLCSDMLINVTSFFRDPLFYKALDQQVFPALLKDRDQNDPLRIWISACAGGEEVVSVAITLLEHVGDRAWTLPVQIFATDLNERTIEKARLGIYKKSALQHLPPEHLKKYFQHVDGHFQVIKTIRDMCVFAKHDLLKDPPFSRVDLVSCQNMLIYLENPAQERVVRSFHYALKPNGFLALGKSESASVAEGLFDQPDRSFKVYTKKHSGERMRLDVRFKPTLFQPTLVEHGPLPATRLNSMADLDRDTERLLLNRYVPASVLVDRRSEIVRFRGTMTPYLAPATGKASLNLLKMVRDDLSFELRGLLQRAKKEKTPVRKGGIPIRVEDVEKHIALEVVPIGDLREPHYLVLFTEEVRRTLLEPPDGRKWKNLRDERERRIVQLEQELAEAREQMRLAAEEAESGQQELQAANEEVVSSNEELQSINEELETSKEELQSINEEFATINEELQARNESLLQSEERYRKLIHLMPVAVYTCDITGQVRLFNEAAVQLWGRAPVVGSTVWSGAVGMRTAEGEDLPLDRSPLAIAIQEERALTDVEMVLMRHGGGTRSVLMNATPLYDNQGRLSGAIGVLSDISERKAAERLLQQSEERFKAIFQRASFGIVLADHEGRMVDVNPAYTALLGYTRDELIGRTSVELGITLDKGQRQRTIAGILDSGSARDVEVRLRRKDGSPIEVRSNADTVMMGDRRYIISIVEDITERKQAEEAKRLLAAIVESSDDAILTRDLDGVITSWNKGAERIFGYTAQEIVGRRNHVIYPPDSKKEEELLLDNVRRGVRVDHYETIRLHKDGTPVHVALTLSPLKDEQGTIIGASKVIRDIGESKRASEAIRTSEERFHLMADNVVQLIWMAEADGSEVWFNRPWYAFTGLVPDQMRMDLESLHHPDHYERVMTSWRSSAAQGALWQEQFPLKSKEGRYHWFMATAMPVLNDAGKVARWFGTLTDITAEREASEQLQANEERFRMLADNMSQMAYVADAAGRITWVNRRWTDFTGMDVDRMNDNGWSRVVDPAHFDAMVRSYAEAQERGEPWEHVFRLRSTAGEYRWFLSRSVPIKDDEGKVERWFGTNTDITAQKLAEEALEESATHKDHFLATLAHELRNPLAPLKNGLQLMELVPDDARTIETTRAMMVRQLDHMVRLVDDLMDLSRISRGKIELLVEPVDLQVVMSTAIESNKPLIERKGQELEVDLTSGPLMVNGDMARLTQVVANLLNNAAKYTPSGGRIQVELERRGTEAVVRVKDNGIGIDPSALPHVFDMFAQVDPSQQAKEGGGLGIGLNIVQRLMAMHNGRIEGHSAGLGQGSEFTVFVPLAEDTAAENDVPAATPMAGIPKLRRVLVVDDNEDAAFSMGIILKKLGHEVQTAHDGLHAVQLAESFRPEVVLMDIGMPRMNGLEACKAMRNTDWGKDLYLVALSGWGQEEDRRKSEEAGFDLHIVKPIDPRTLERVIQEAEK